MRPLSRFSSTILAVSTALDFGTVPFLRPDFTQGVDWSNAFWQSNQSWKVISAAGGLTNFANLRLVAEDWQDAQGDRFSSVLSGREFVLRQDGGDVWLDLVMAEGAADNDGDGWTQRDESIWGTSDTAGASFFRSITVFQPGVGFTLTWNARKRSTEGH